MKENKRLKELKLSLYINHIDKADNKIQYSNIMKVLSCLAATFNKEVHKEFTKLIQLTLGECFLRATPKEIVATCKTYFNNKQSAKVLDISYTTFYYRYKDLLNRDFINNEFIESLQPMFNSEDGVLMVDILTKFIEDFKYELGRESHELFDKERTFEIEFLLIYNKLIEVLNNVGACDKFIFNVCNVFDIDYTSIAQLKNNIHIINRSYPSFRYNNRYLMQEIVTLYTKKGVSKGAIGSKVLGKDSTFLYNGTNKKFSEIPKDDLDWQYTPTLDWSNINKGSVYKFINLFHDFIRYDI